MRSSCCVVCASSSVDAAAWKPFLTQTAHQEERQGRLTQYTSCFKVKRCIYSELIMTQSTHASICQYYHSSQISLSPSFLQESPGVLAGSCTGVFPGSPPDKQLLVHLLCGLLSLSLSLRQTTLQSNQFFSFFASHFQVSSASTSLSGPLWCIAAPAKTWRSIY